jgi:phospholipid/cholesterol/gamma-HCH transport system substrate-binding protein
MRESWNAARVGLMVVLGLVVTFAVYRYVDERSDSDSGYGVYAYFDDVQGLVAKSRVLVAGIPVGYISSIRLEGARARVDLRLKGSLTLYEDARVTMKSLSLLGERALIIHPGTQGLPEIEDGGQILAADKGVQTDDILVTVNDIAQSVKKITAQMERAFGTEEAGDRMQSALRNLSDALENIKQVTDEAGPRIVRIMENVELATGDLSNIIHKRKDDIDRGIAEVDDTIASIHRASEQLNAVLADVKEITGRTARGEGTIGRLTQDEALIDEVEGVAEGLNNFVGGLNRLRTIVELRSEYYALSNAFKTYFSVYLKPREGRYFLVQVVDDPRGSIRARRLCFTQTSSSESRSRAATGSSSRRSLVSRSRLRPSGLVSSSPAEASAWISRSSRIDSRSTPIFSSSAGAYGRECGSAPGSRSSAVSGSWRASTTSSMAAETTSSGCSYVLTTKI